VSGFLTRYYSEASHVPREIVLTDMPEDADAIELWLGVRRGEQGERATRVRLTAPQRGLKADLVSLANRNAQHALMRFMVRTRYSDARTNEALMQLESALALPRPPLRIECFDISTLHGTHSVGSMVVFADGQPERSSYRRFKVRLDTGEANDVAMMREVLTRRFSEANRSDQRFASQPHLVVVDGGKPQLSAARQALDDAGVNVPIVGIAKRDEEIWVEWSDAPVVLPDGSPSLYLIKRVRDEAHRFAIEYHRLLRSKAMTTGILDEVPGIGPKRKRDILKHFGSMKKLRLASAEEIAAVPGVAASAAEDLYALLRASVDTPA